MSSLIHAAFKAASTTEKADPPESNERLTSIQETRDPLSGSTGREGGKLARIGLGDIALRALKIIKPEQQPDESNHTGGSSTRSRILTALSLASVILAAPVQRGPKLQSSDILDVPLIAPRFMPATGPPITVSPSQHNNPFITIFRSGAAPSARTTSLPGLGPEHNESDGPVPTPAPDTRPLAARQPASSTETLQFDPAPMPELPPPDFPITMKRSTPAIVTVPGRLEARSILPSDGDSCVYNAHGICVAHKST